VTLVQRSATTVASVESAGLVVQLFTEGRSVEDTDLVALTSTHEVSTKGAQLLARAMYEKDSALIDGLNEIGFKTDYGEGGTGFQFKYFRREGGYYLNVGCSELLISGHISLLQFTDIEQFVPDGVRLVDGTHIPVDLIVLATGYQNLQEQVRLLFGNEIADAVGPVWGFDPSGEIYNTWKRTAQPGLWFHAGSLPQARTFSKYLALQIKAVEEGLLDAAAPAMPVVATTP
jgi:hypothetical protein